MENGSQSLRQRTRNAIERLDAVENSVTQIIQAINQSMGNMNNQISGVTEVLDAVVALFGVDAVQNQVVEARKARQQEQSDAQMKQVEELKKQGVLVPQDKVEEQSLLVGRETTKDGQVVHPGRFQHHFAQIQKEVSAKMLGQAVGFKVETPAGGHWEILEIYKIVPKTPEQLAADAAVAEATAAVAAEAAAASTTTPEAAALAETPAETAPAPAAPAAEAAPSSAPAPAQPETNGVQ